jgi:predicted dehydrogenase
MQKVRIAVVGTGSIAQLVHLPVLSRLPEVEIVALCDHQRPKLKVLGEKYGITSLYTSVQELLSSSAVDAIDICVSTENHLEAAVAALEAGVHVLVERPLALTYRETQQIVGAAEKAKKTLMVGNNHRFRPDAMILRSFIEAREIGKVFYAKTGWLRKTDPTKLKKSGKRGGGILINEGLVLIDSALWMLGFPAVEKVSAAANDVLGLGMEDTITALLRLANGGTIFIEASWAVKVEEDVLYCDVYGSDGTGMLNPFRIQKVMHGSLVNVTPAKMDDGREAYQRSYLNEFRHFIGAVRGLHPAVSTGEEALQRMKLVEAIRKSIDRRREVPLPAEVS